MGNNQTEKAFEEKRLAQTISLAEEQLKQAKEAADKKKSEIIEAKKDVRENTEHGITSLYTSDGFEALVELSQYINPVTDKIIDYEEEEHKILLLEKMIKSPYFARIDFKFDDEDEFEKIKTKPKKNVIYLKFLAESTVVLRAKRTSIPCTEPIIRVTTSG